MILNLHVLAFISTWAHFWFAFSVNYPIPKTILTTLIFWSARARTKINAFYAFEHVLGVTVRAYLRELPCNKNCIYSKGELHYNSILFRTVFTSRSNRNSNLQVFVCLLHVEFQIRL